MDSTSPQPGQSQPEREREREREVCIRAKERIGEGIGRLCTTIFNLLGFITTVSLTANSHCMADGLAPVCLPL